MKGSIYKRKGGASWTAKWDGPRGANGKRQLRYRSGFATKKDAERFLRRTLGSLDDGSYVEPNRVSFGEFLTSEWLVAMENRELRPSTRASYRMNVSAYIGRRIGHLPLQRITPADLNRLYADLRANGRADGKGGLSARSVRLVHCIIHRALADAMRWGRVTRNAADAADPPAASAARADAERARGTWSPAQLATFVEHSRQHRLGVAFLLSGATGLRRGELLGLRWADLVLDATLPHLIVRQTVIAVNGSVQLSTPKTSKGTRSVSLDARTVEALRTHRREQLEERMLLGRDYLDSDLVFCGLDGSPLRPDSFTKTFDQLVKTSGLPRIRQHDLRHSHATHGLAAGVHAKTMSDRLGHSTIAITMDVYSHSIPATDAAAAELIAAQVHGAAPAGSS